MHAAPPRDGERRGMPEKCTELARRARAQEAGMGYGSPAGPAVHAAPSTPSSLTAMMRAVSYGLRAILNPISMWCHHLYDDREDGVT